MKATVLLLALSATLSLAVADLAGAKKEGLNRVNRLSQDMSRLADETSVEVGKREENIKIISKHENEFGSGIYEKLVFEVKRTAQSAYMMAKLLGSSNEVFRCVEAREREALDDSGRYFNDRFMTPARDLETKAEMHQRDVIRAWKDEYYKASRQYGDIYKRAISDIEKATSESQVSSIVRNFESTTKQMSEIILRIHPDMAKIHIQVLQTLDQQVRNLQDFANRRIETTTRAIQNCFPRTFEKDDLSMDLIL